MVREKCTKHGGYSISFLKAVKEKSWMILMRRDRRGLLRIKACITCNLEIMKDVLVLII